LTLLLSIALAGTSRESPTTTNATVIFKAGEDGYHTYRIPSMLHMGSGTLLCFCEGRKQSADHGWNDVVLKRSHDEGITWGPLELVYTESTTVNHVTIGNPSPVAVYSQPGKIVMLLCKNNQVVLQIESSDDGVSWTKTGVEVPLNYPGQTWVATGPPTSLQGVLASSCLLIT